MQEADRDRPEEDLVAELHALRARVASLERSEALLRSVVAAIEDPVYAKDERGRYTMVNPAAERVLARPAAEVLGRLDADLFPPDTARRIREDDARIMAEGLVLTQEQVATLADHARLYLTTKAPLRDDRGRVFGVVGISRDITERKRDEEALHEAREFLARLLEHAPAPIYVAGRDGRRRLVNRAWEELWGRPRQEVLGRKLEEIFAPELARRFRDQNREVLDTGYPLVVEEEVAAPDGPHYLHTVKFPLRDTADEIDSVGGISFDVTERKRAEEALRAGERQFRAVFEGSLDAMVLADDAGRYVDVNPAACSLFGLSRDRLLGRAVADFAEPGLGLEGAWAEFRGAGSSQGLFRLVRPDGAVRVTEYAATADILPGRHLSVLRDVTERLRAEEAVRESERRVVAILESITDAFFAVDREWRFSYLNHQAESLTGRSRRDLLGRDLWEEFDAAIGTAFERQYYRAVTTGHPVAFEEYYPPLGRWFNVHAYPSSDGLSVYFTDVTDRRRSDAALREYAERLQVLSRRVVEVQEEERRRLARELHDEIGQTFTAIGINLQALKRRGGAEMLPQLDECIDLVGGAIRQVRHLSLDLRPSMLDDLGLVAALRWHLDRQAQRVGYRARFVADPDEARLDPAIAIAAFRVAQEALTNVARHARASRVGVAMRLRGGALRLVIGDDGVGFDPEAALRHGARGEGLGLLGMRERGALLGGRVAIRSSPGRGTTVRLTIFLESGA